MSRQQTLQEQAEEEAVAKADLGTQAAFVGQSFEFILRTALIMIPVLAWNSAFLSTIDRMVPNGARRRQKTFSPNLVAHYLYAIGITIAVVLLLLYTPL